MCPFVQAKALYQHVTSQADSLKEFWIAKLNLRGKSDIASPEELQAYEATNDSLKAELERRKLFGKTFSGILAAQEQLVLRQEEGRARYRVAIATIVREIRRMLQQFYESRDHDDVLSQFDEQLRHRCVYIYIVFV